MVRPWRAGCSNGKHDVGVYNRSPGKLKALTDAGANLGSDQGGSHLWRGVSPCSPTDAALLRW